MIPNTDTVLRLVPLLLLQCDGTYTPTISLTCYDPLLSGLS